jgi:hypothetical protein
VQLASISASHRSWNSVPSGRIDSGASFWNSHLIALIGMPGAAHGVE